MATQSLHSPAPLATSKESAPRVNVVEQVLALRASHPGTKLNGSGSGPLGDRDKQENDVRSSSNLDT